MNTRQVLSLLLLLFIIWGAWSESIGRHLRLFAPYYTSAYDIWDEITKGPSAILTESEMKGVYARFVASGMSEPEAAGTLTCIPLFEFAATLIFNPFWLVLIPIWIFGGRGKKEEEEKETEGEKSKSNNLGSSTDNEETQLCEKSGKKGGMKEEWGWKAKLVLLVSFVLGLISLIYYVRYGLDEKPVSFTLQVLLVISLALIYRFKRIGFYLFVGLKGLMLVGSLLVLPTVQTREAYLGALVFTGGRALVAFLIMFLVVYPRWGEMDPVFGKNE